MFLLLAFLFLVVPIIELYVIVQVASSVGVLETIGLLIVISVVGAWLVRHEGMSVMRKVQTQLQQGQMPTKQLVDGALILFAGALMLTPGFVTDALGVLLLVPPTRIAIRGVLMRRFRRRVTVIGGSSGASAPGGFPFGATYVDVDGTESPTARDIVDLTRDDEPRDPPAAINP